MQHTGAKTKRSLWTGLCNFTITIFLFLANTDRLTDGVYVIGYYGKQNSDVQKKPHT